MTKKKETRINTGKIFALIIVLILISLTASSAIVAETKLGVTEKEVVDLEDGSDKRVDRVIFKNNMTEDEMELYNNVEDSQRNVTVKNPSDSSFASEEGVVGVVSSNNSSVERLEVNNDPNGVLLITAMLFFVSIVSSLVYADEFESAGWAVITIVAHATIVAYVFL